MSTPVHPTCRVYAGLILLLSRVRDALAGERPLSDDEIDLLNEITDWYENLKREETKA